MGQTPSAPVNQLAEDIRSALRCSDGPAPTVADDNNEKNNNNNNNNKTELPPKHRSHRLLDLLDKATPDDITTEHMLELVDNRWEETADHTQTPRAVKKMVALAKPEHLNVLITACLLNQRCWIALDEALSRMMKTRTTTRTQLDGSSRLFVQACQAAPLGCVLKLLELGWVDTRPAAAAEQFRILVSRFLVQFRPPLSPEEKERRAREAAASKKAAVFRVGSADEDDDDDNKGGNADEKKRIAQKKKLQLGEAATALDDPVPVLIRFLQQQQSAHGRLGTSIVKGASDNLLALVASSSDNDDEDVAACSALSEVLLSFCGPWNQVAATVGETPMSWRVSNEVVRRRVVLVSLCLKKRGLTFPGYCKVLSFLIAPNVEII